MMERKKANTLEELLKDCPQNIAVLKMFTKTWTVVNDPSYERIACKIFFATQFEAIRTVRDAYAFVLSLSVSSAQDMHGGKSGACG